MRYTNSQYAVQRKASPLTGWAAFLMMGVLLGTGFPSEVYPMEPDRTAFDWELVEDASPLPNGMMLVMYGEPKQGTITHVSFHRVLRVLPGVEPDLPAEEAARLTVLITDGTLGPLTYIILKEPLYYGTDLDELGLPRRLWQDSEEDGVNGNEELVARVELTLDEMAYHK